MTPLLWCHRRDEPFVLMHSFTLRLCHRYVALPVGECHPVSASPLRGSQVPTCAGRVLVGSECTGHEHTQEQLWRTCSVYWGETKAISTFEGEEREGRKIGVTSNI